MGRRALRKIDPSLDLSQHLFSVERGELPPSLVDIFREPRPLEIEIGSGKGLFLGTAAKRNPEHNFLGVEIARKYARFAAARLAKAKLANAAVIAGDGQVLIQQQPDRSVHAVHVYFPDPWWKKRHRKRRIFQPVFIRQVQRVLEFSGRLHFWTDVKSYFDEALEQIAACSQLDGPSPVPDNELPQRDSYRTHFERRMRLNEKPVYRVQFQKSTR